jgi:hypothetical protein
MAASLRRGEIAPMKWLFGLGALDWLLTDSFELLGWLACGVVAGVLAFPAHCAWISCREAWRRRRRSEREVNSQA